MSFISYPQEDYMLHIPLPYKICIKIDKDVKSDGFETKSYNIENQTPSHFNHNNDTYVDIDKIQNIDKSNAIIIRNKTLCKYDNLMLTTKELHKGIWPSKVKIHCFWDCHKFDTCPIGIPINITSNSIITVGCYCSFQCAAAANISDIRISDIERNNRHNNIIMLYNDINIKNNNTVIKPFEIAPDRECLDIFGGNLTIHEFRNSSISTEYVMYPPFVPYEIYQLSGRDKNDNNNDSGYNKDPSEWMLDIESFDSQYTNGESLNKFNEKGLGKFMKVSFNTK